MKLPDLRLFKKSFVSLVITPTKVQALKLDGTKKSATHFAEVNLPPGVISSYRVKDQEALIAKIQEVWKMGRFGERFVGVVVPEFSTYTKTINLPNLSDTEISEALNWQVQEFLPASLEEVVMDWKLIKRDKKGVEVLAVAIMKDILYSYIDAVGKAGLMPLVVETPSLSLERATSSQGGKLIIHLNSPEALLVLTDNKKVVASSVVTSKNTNIVLNTAIQMISHYKSVSVDKIFVSGPALTQELIQTLHYNLGTPIQLLNIEIAGLSQAQVNEYLISISLQYKDPAEPASELTINLLPPSWAVHYKEKSAGIQAWTLTLVISIVIWTNFLSAVIALMFIGLQAQDLSRRAQSNGVESLNEIVAEINRVNSLSKKVITISEGITPFQPIVNQIESARGPGVVTNKYAINMETGSISVLGSASDRASLLAFKSQVEGLEGFTQVDVPIQYLLQESNISFELKVIYESLVAPTRQQIRLNI